MRLQFLGAAETTSGSCYLLSFTDQKVLVDCGLFQGPEELKQRNYGDFPFDPREIDAVILTHAHIDHSGLLPKLVKAGFRGSIYATGVTVDLCRIMLADSGHIQESEVERKNRKLQRRGQKLLAPIYTVEDAATAMKQFKAMIYDEEMTILPTLRMRFRDAGHILGAAIVELWVSEGEETIKLVFSGDLGHVGQPIVQDPTFLSEADILIIESTYGTRLHENQANRMARLAEIVNETLEQGGNLIIPAFAVGRTQDLLYSLRVLQDQGAVPLLHIYIDSPLATAATEVFAKHAQIFDYKARTMINEGRSPFDAPGLHYTETVEESMRLNKVAGGLVIMAGSGMADAGRIKHHLKHNLWRKQATVLFVGYQAQGTLGRLLQDGAKEVRIHGEPVKVEARIETIPGFSAHGDQEALLTWLRRFRSIGRIFVTHGEKESCHGFAELIQRELGVPAVVPRLDEGFDFKGLEARSTWDQRYHDFSVDNEFSGVVQVTRDQNIEFRGAYGLANRRYKVKNTFFTAFNLGSAQNFFARTALASLVEQGKLSAAALEPWSAEVDWEERLKELTGEQPWAVVTREVLVPAEMKQSAYYYLDQVPVQGAVGYTVTTDGQMVENIYAILKDGFRPQLFSTAHDLRRFWQVLAHKKLLRGNSLEALLVPYGGQTPGPEQTLRGQNPVLIPFQIAGFAPGVRVMFGGSLEPLLFMAVLSNGEEDVEGIFAALRVATEKDGVLP